MKNIRKTFLTIILSLVLVAGLGNLARGQCTCVPGCAMGFGIRNNTTCDTIHIDILTNCCESFIFLAPTGYYNGGCVDCGDGSYSCAIGYDMTNFGYPGTFVTGGYTGPWTMPSYGNTPCPGGCTTNGLTITWNALLGEYDITCP